MNFSSCCLLFFASRQADFCRSAAESSIRITSNDSGNESVPTTSKAKEETKSAAARASRGPSAGCRCRGTALMQKTGRAVNETQTPWAVHAPANCTGDFLISALEHVSPAGGIARVMTNHRIENLLLLGECGQRGSFRVVQPRGW